MSDAKKPRAPANAKVVGAKTYHDYRQGRADLRDCCLTKRPGTSPPAVGHGSGFKGF